MAVWNQTLPRLPIYIVLFAATVMIFCAAEARYNLTLKRIQWIGHTSYSNYLLHSPLQMVFLFLASFGLIDPKMMLHWAGMPL